jgi:hypothetical protein
LQRQRRGIQAAAIALTLGLALHGMAGAKTIRFSGYDWTVRSGTGGPGPCTWSESNVAVDANGDLHLKLKEMGKSWSCAEIESVRRLGFGAYQFWVVGAIDRLDPNVVLGLFNYPTPDLGPDGTNELDVEIARWGDPAAPNLNFTAWPARAGLPPAGKSYFFSLDGTYTTHRFTWSGRGIRFQSLNGHRNDDQSPIAAWSFVPPKPARRVPQHPEPVHLNLWLHNGLPPTDGKEVEIVIRSFTYKP